MGKNQGNYDLYIKSRENRFFSPHARRVQQRERENTRERSPKFELREFWRELASGRSVQLNTPQGFEKQYGEQLYIVLLFIC